MNLTGLYVQKRIIIYWHIFHSSSFHHICNIKCRLDCRYSPQNIFNAKNFNPHKKPISLLNAPICTHGMQQTWWPEAGTIIVTELYYKYALKWWYHLYKKKLKQERRSKRWNTFSGLEISIRRPTVNTLDLSAPPPPPPPHTHTHTNTQITKTRRSEYDITTQPLDQWTNNPFMGQ